MTSQRPTKEHVDDVTASGAKDLHQRSIINMADWLARRQMNGNFPVRRAFSDRGRPSRPTVVETGRLKLTQAQRKTILDHAALPDDLVARLIIEESGGRTNRFTIEELNVLQDNVGEAARYATGFVRQKLMHVAEKLSTTRGHIAKGVWAGDSPEGGPSPRMFCGTRLFPENWKPK